MIPLFELISLGLIILGVAVVGHGPTAIQEIEGTLLAVFGFLILALLFIGDAIVQAIEKRS